MKLYQLTIVTLVFVVLVSCTYEPKVMLLSTEVVKGISESKWIGEYATAEIPPTWKVEPVFGMRDGSFRVIGNEEVEGEVTLSRLPISGGTLLSNVNRWRGQVGMDPLGEKELFSGHQRIDVSGLKGVSLNLIPLAPSQTGILGLVLEDEEFRYYIKFSGPKNLLVREESSWQSFVNSLEFREVESK